MAREVLVAASLAVQGVHKREKLDNVTMPVLKHTTETWRGAGGLVDQEISLGLEVIVAQFSIVGLDLDLQNAISLSKRDKLFVIYAYARQKGGANVKVKVTMRGLLKPSDQDAVEGNNLVKNGWEFVCDYYKYEQAGKIVHEVDVNGTVMIIGGVDEAAAHNEGLGL
ncbi:MAG: hypothetical protein COB24_12025 [Hyphomicrobiales bacterium]|nr:MAG: hypothetical protein COB24_12025 [Hyphomicrobiales bacterium]